MFRLLLILPSWNLVGEYLPQPLRICKSVSSMTEIILLTGFCYTVLLDRSLMARLWRLQCRLTYHFTVQHSFHQLVAAVAQGQEEEGGILPQQVQEDLVSFPFGQAV